MRDEIEAARAAVTDAAARLRATGIPPEPLAEFVPPRRVLLFTTEPKLRAIGEVWRLGVFLVDPDATLYAAGSTTRAVEPGRSNNQSVSGEERRMHRAAAHRGRFEEGATVNFGASVIELSEEGLAAASGPLFVADGRLLVRWNPRADATTGVAFVPYLRERLELLLAPPAGA
jgi:hypothetical protein